MRAADSRTDAGLLWNTFTVCFATPREFDIILPFGSQLLLTIPARHKRIQVFHKVRWSIFSKFIQVIIHQSTSLQQKNAVASASLVDPPVCSIPSVFETVKGHKVPVFFSHYPAGISVAAWDVGDALRRIDEEASEEGSRERRRAVM